MVQISHPIQQIDVVIHLAAQTHVDLSFGNSISFTATNVGIQVYCTVVVGG